MDWYGDDTCRVRESEDEKGLDRRKEGEGREGGSGEREEGRERGKGE